MKRQAVGCIPVVWALVVGAQLPAQAPTSAPVLTEPPVSAASRIRGERTSGEFTLKVDVNLVLVEATVRDARNRLVDTLTQEDFLLFEDGVPQQIRHFCRDALPLAVALVVDGSRSVAPVLPELHQAVRDTLSQLKPEDQVALFGFAGHPERLEDLTTNRKSIAERIPDVGAAGGTNIADALYAAITYLGQEARERRHAVILVSDNQPTAKGKVAGEDVIRLALETQTIVYSVRIGRDRLLGTRGKPLWIPGAGWVNTIMGETGGEMIDLAAVGSVRKAMAAVIARLKQRYTLGYLSTNPRRDGAFREIDVRLSARLHDAKYKYRVSARRGYYAPRPTP